MDADELDPFSAGTPKAASSSSAFSSPGTSAVAGAVNSVSSPSPIVLQSPTLVKISQPVEKPFASSVVKGADPLAFSSSSEEALDTQQQFQSLSGSHANLENGEKSSNTAASSSSYLPSATEPAAGLGQDAVEGLTTAMEHHKVRTSSSVNMKHPIVLDLPVLKSNFIVTVSDPITVGDGLKAHTEYTVISKSNLENFKDKEFSVRRRYREFLWLYQQLSNKYPGVIVPPPPEKHAIGRFEGEFVENRRAQLERMLRKIGAHSILQKDSDFHAFLTSQAFQGEIQEKKVKTSFMSKLGDAVSGASSAFQKTHEVDEWFDEKKNYLDQLESQLKSIAKSIDTLVKHRDDVADTTLDFGESIFALASAEINKNTEKHLTEFGEIQKQIKEVHESQARSEIYYLANTMDEYIRIIGSIRNAFTTRTKAYQNWQLSEQNLIKLRISLEKTKLHNKTKPEKVAQIESEIIDAESKIVSTKKEFEEITRVLKEEMAAFEREKVDDINAAMQNYLESMIKHQENIIQIWESYFTQVGETQ